MIRFTWNGKDISVRPTHRLLRDIEAEVSISRLANLLSRATAGDAMDVPMSHVSFIVATLLKYAGEQVDELAVHQQMLRGEGDYGSALRDLMTSYYGAGPETPVQSGKAEAGNTPPST